MCTQLLLVAAFKRSGDQALRQSAGYTAHHLIALAFMVIATLVGSAGWLSSSAAAVTASARLLAPNGTARWLAAVLLGELLLWDYPCALFIKKLRAPVMLVHHAGMVATAYLVMLCPSFYGTFYLGWTELSSIPMQLWEVFGHAHEVATDAARKQLLARLRDVSYHVFGALFLLVRILAFTAITARGLLPDIRALLPTAAAASARTPLIGFMGLSVAFNALMLGSLAAGVWGLLADESSQ